jgi:hypothetical protein
VWVALCIGLPDKRERAITDHPATSVGRGACTTGAKTNLTESSERNLQLDGTQFRSVGALVDSLRARELPPSCLLGQRRFLRVRPPIQETTNSLRPLSPAQMWRFCLSILTIMCNTCHWQGGAHVSRFKEESTPERP